MNKVELEITDITPSGSSSGAYALVLSEVKGNRKLPIVIGSHEAQAIAIEMENMKPGRPLTHDLFKTFAFSYHIDVTEVIIYNLIEGIFFARLITSQNGKSVNIDARTSDAVALAVRFKCPIMCENSILDKAGIVVEDLELDEDDDQENEEKVVPEKRELTVVELEEKLQEALDNEDYELASKIRDRINSMKS